MKTALVILCTGDYEIGAKVMFYTLAKHGKLPDSVDRIALGMSQCDFAIPKPIKSDYSWVSVSQEYFPKVADKFEAFLLPYDRIIMMDADMLCLGDCSLLWSDRLGSQPFYAVRDTASQVHYADVIPEIGLNPDLLFNAGTMVFQMDRLGGEDFYCRLMGRIVCGALKSYDGGDQGYLNHYFQLYEREIGYLPQEYNGCLDFKIPQVPNHAVKIVHFTGGNINPWNVDKDLPSNDVRRPLLNRWAVERKDCEKARP